MLLGGEVEARFFDDADRSFVPFLRSFDAGELDDRFRLPAGNLAEQCSRLSCEGVATKRRERARADASRR